uniref:Uncharacterized protein n=1 Tax=Pycnococcus provasolii TaxID=41880 RepID=A0A7S2YZH8_9CHLO
MRGGGLNGGASRAPRLCFRARDWTSRRSSPSVTMMLGGGKGGSSYDGNDSASGGFHKHFGNSNNKKLPPLRFSKSQHATDVAFGPTPAPKWLKQSCGEQLLSHALQRLQDAPFFVFVKEDDEAHLAALHAPTDRAYLTHNTEGLFKARCRCQEEGDCFGHMLVAELFDARVMVDADDVALVAGGTVRVRYASGSAVKGSHLSYQAPRSFVISGRCCCEDSDCPTACYLATLFADGSTTIQPARLSEKLMAEVLLLG